MLRLFNPYRTLRTPTNSDYNNRRLLTTTCNNFFPWQTEYVRSPPTDIIDIKVNERDPLTLNSETTWTDLTSMMISLRKADNERKVSPDYIGDTSYPWKADNERKVLADHVGITYFPWQTSYE